MRLISAVSEPEKNADSLEAQLEAAQAKAAENWDNLLRAKAEMDNLRRRNAKDVENAHKYALEKFVTELLPIIDGMEMGLNVEEASVDSMKQGMELTRFCCDKLGETEKRVEMLLQKADGALAWQELDTDDEDGDQEDEES